MYPTRIIAEADIPSPLFVFFALRSAATRIIALSGNNRHSEAQRTSEERNSHWLNDTALVRCRSIRSPVSNADSLSTKSLILRCQLGPITQEHPYRSIFSNSCCYVGDWLMAPRALCLCGMSSSGDESKFSCHRLGASCGRCNVSPLTTIAVYLCVQDLVRGNVYRVLERGFHTVPTQCTELTSVSSYLTVQRVWSQDCAPENETLLPLRAWKSVVFVAVHKLGYLIRVELTV